MEKISKQAVLEGLLFLVGDDGLTIEQMMNILELEKEECFNLINELKNSYEDINRGIRINFLGNTFKSHCKKQ